MSGILIYSEYEANRNAFAVRKFSDNLGIELVMQENVDFSINTDFVINRTNNGKIAEEFEKRGIRVFNPSSLTYLANNKQCCYEFMSENGIKIMPVNYKGIPVVIKPSDGKGGQDVQLIKHGNNFFKEGYVYQKPASDLGKDLRVWLIGKRIIASALRESKTDFRSNFCLGGNASVYSLSQEEKKLVFQIAELLNYDYIGIDFVFDKGKIVFNEVEDAVGARMVYELTNIDIIKEYCEYIKGCI